MTGLSWVKLLLSHDRWRRPLWMPPTVDRSWERQLKVPGSSWVTRPGAGPLHTHRQFKQIAAATFRNGNSYSLSAAEERRLTLFITGVAA